MSAAASELELELESGEASANDLNEVSDPHLAQSLDILASTSPPGSSKPVIAVDLDDVLSQTNAAVASWHNEQYGTKMTLDDFYYHYYWKNPHWGGLEQTHDKVRDFYASSKLSETLPIPGSRAGVQTLHDMGFKLIIVTARSPEEKENSWKWIDKWFPGLFDNIICTGQFKDMSKNGFGVVTKLSKAQVCADLKALVLIDDSSENALQVSTSSSAATPPTPVLLFGQYEWNKRLSTRADAVDTMVFDTRLQIEGGKEFWKDEKLEDHIPEGAPLHRVKDWPEVVRWVRAELK
ncbi:hypothetical protein BDP27DRAFT_1390893 [Rhodocollybia butyracea]|uniref:Uncharacterized protein n=1 Tax=Rhodocollybia butyracea TaxID=206335 RepID=A0A9P5UC89_9AGAR|nr:hypothetical protein BDP27DRAFT_1390893 [Rhodocollybia butyracea]